MLKIEKISKTFNPGTIHEKAALQGLSLHLLPGDFVTVIGSNGAGKSTLLNAISGSFFTDSGSIYLDGRNITFLPEYQRSRQIGRLFQDPMRGSAPHMTIEENLSLAAASGGWLSHVTRAEKAAFREKLAQLDMGLENRMKQPVGLLSGGQSLPQLFSSIISIVSVFVSMIVLNVPLTLLTLVMVALMLFATKKIAGKSGKFFVRQQQDLGKVNGYIEEMMQGQKVVKVFNHEQAAIERFNELNEQLRDSSCRANSYANVLMPVNAQLGNVSYVLCVVAGAALALHGYVGLTLGTLAAFMTLNRSFNQPTTQVSQQLNSVVMAMAGAERVFRLLDEKSETDEGYVTLVNAVEHPDGTLTESEKRTGVWAWKHPHQADGTVTYTKLAGDVVFHDVDFGYTPEKIVLHNIDLYATPGQKIAFVGSTGAGKTTITNLINRFYDIADGKIRYDGININKIRKDDLRRSLGMVLQDTHLFTGTVMENIRYGRLDATDEECIAAAKLANADGFIERLPNGYDTMLTSDGANLSQGQRQLLAIARAAVADPPVLILDEATSSIDTRTEALVQAGMDGLMKGRTTFVIAHRLSTVRNADCIMVLEQGRIIERGTHDDLIAQKGRYYQLYTGKMPEK